MEQKIQPIINGSANPRLTPEMFKELPFESQRSVIWNIMVSMGYAHSFKGVDPRCFIKHDEEHSIGQITEENADTLFVEIREKFNRHHELLLAKTRNLHYGLGQKIYEAQKELGFGGFIHLDAYRLKGYIQACGDWNDFRASNVGVAVARLDKQAPTTDYGPNNVNTGNIMHKWKTVHGCEYVMLEFGFVGQKDMERIQKFYESHWQPTGKSIKADSIRIEVTPVDDNKTYFDVELVMWWD